MRSDDKLLLYRSTGLCTTLRSLRRACIVFVFIFALATVVARGQTLRACEQDLLQGRADQAIAGLLALTAQSSGDGGTHLLLCRAYLSELRGAEAAEQCRMALRSGLASSSVAQDWAGRAFGMEAEHAGPVAGLKLAAEVRNAFLTAYRLDPHNAAAADDLGEYYVHAPFLVGGGSAKALSLAVDLQSSLPGITHRLRALVAEKDGNMSLAEREFLAAAQLTQAPGALVDLSCFYVRRGVPEKAADAARRAISADRTLDANIVDAASSLNDVHLSAQAVQTLRLYLDRGEHSDAAPVFRVHTLLGAILTGQGLKVEARKEFQTALALASRYPPAEKGLASL